MKSKPPDSPADGKKAAALPTARMKFESMQAAAMKKADPKADSLRAAAMMSLLPGSTGSNNTPAPGAEGKIKEADTMPKNLTEFLAQGEAAVAEVEKFKTDAVAAERTRVKALNEMRTKYATLGAAVELIDNAIADGRSREAIALAVSDLVLAAAESAKAVNAGSSDTATGESAAPVDKPGSGWIKPKA